jgi:hypothetical protein
LNAVETGRWLPSIKKRANRTGVLFETNGSVAFLEKFLPAT